MCRSRSGCVLGLVCLLLAAGQPCRAGDHYVDAVRGSDGTGDGSAANPWRTISHAFAQFWAPVFGEHLWVAAGVYDSALGESFPLWLPEGMSIHGDPAGGTQILSEGENGLLAQLFEGAACAGVIEHLRLDGHQGSVRAPGPGLDASCVSEVHDNTVTGYGFGLVGSVASAPFGLAAQYLAVIDANSIVDNGSAAVFQAYDEYAFGLDLRPVLTNNVFADNDQGIHIRAECALCAPGSEVAARVVNNTVVANGSSGLVLELFQPEIVSAVEVVNNIFASNDGYAIDDSFAGPSRIQLNDFWMNSSGRWVVGLNDTGDNLDVDPIFNAPAARNYTLRVGSPCIDAGSNPDAPAADRDGNPRPADGDGDSTPIVDMGAYELQEPGMLRLRRGDFLSLSPLDPTRTDMFPIDPANPLTPVILDPFVSGASDPEPGILTNTLLPLVVYGVDDAASLTAYAVKDQLSQSVRIELR